MVRSIIEQALFPNKKTTRFKEEVEVHNGFSVCKTYDEQGNQIIIKEVEWKYPTLIIYDEGQTSSIWSTD